MELSDFDYVLPKELIALYPNIRRDACRLMVVDRARGSVEHKIFADILEYVFADDLLVLNDTKVIKARLIGRKKTGGKVDILLLKRKSSREFSCLCRPADLKINEKIIFDGEDLEAILVEKGIIRFNTDNLNFIYSKGLMPLPPYIKRVPEKNDEEYYQTVFAKNDGSVASPTAGLHFTKRILSRIETKGVKLAYLTLHVNYATFKPVKEKDISRHKMYQEYFEVRRSALDLINQTQQKNKRVFACGTTSCRVIEANADKLKNIKRNSFGLKGLTDLFIYPGYKFKAVDCLLTNFHLPRTTLLMLVCAFAGRDLIMRSYREAIEKKYRFYSYGDAMLII